MFLGLMALCSHVAATGSFDLCPERQLAKLRDLVVHRSSGGTGLVVKGRLLRLAIPNEMALTGMPKSWQERSNPFQKAFSLDCLALCHPDPWATAKIGAAVAYCTARLHERAPDHPGVM